jgi:hypothetical protein
MTPYSANPFAYVFSVVAICAVVGYFMYAVVDRMGLEVSTAVATVTGKQFTPSGKSYYTTIVQGRSWVQSQETPETYAVMLSVNGERTVGLASKQQYEELQVDDSVQVKLRRTRITKRLEVIEITR